MILKIPVLLLLIALVACRILLGGGPSSDQSLKTEFRTSDRCVPCHNELKTSSGEDISIGFQWRASIMANSSRDPYWQGSVRRESIDHPESKADIEDECSICHMPITHLSAKSEGKKAKIFSHLPLSKRDDDVAAAADGVSCSVCHQIEKERLGTPESYNGNVVIAGLNNKDRRPEYGPFMIDAGHQRIMHSSTGGFVPQQGDHIRDAGLCGSCHTLKTKALGPDGKAVGSLPEQMPYEEWLHSSFNAMKTCQECHMPQVLEPVPITAVFGMPREGMRRHDFIGANFFMEGILNVHRDELSVKALPQDLTLTLDETKKFLTTQAARVTIPELQQTAGVLDIGVLVENLTGHKLPTAYPSRRAWLHLVVKDSQGRRVFESGKLNPDGSIAGNDNDADPLRFEPYHRLITSPDQVQIFEPILKDYNGKVTTGLLSAIGYLKDSRILPDGFEKVTAIPDIAVIGDAAADPDFTGGKTVARYNIDIRNLAGPFHVTAELWYQPIGFRWAHNLAPYTATEPQRFLTYYEQMAGNSAIVLASAEANR
jgi:hypothetical protein